MATPSILSSIRSATQIEPRISPKNSADILIGCSSSSVSITDESAKICGEDAGEQCEQPHPFDSFERVDGATDITCQQLFEGVSALADVADELVVDAEDEGDRPARHARHDVGRAHRETADDLGDGGGNSHAARLATEPLVVRRHLGDTGARHRDERYCRHRP